MTYNEWRQKCLDDRLRLGEDKEVKGGGGGGDGVSMLIFTKTLFSNICSTVVF